MERWLELSQPRLCSFERILFLLRPAGSPEPDLSKRFLRALLAHQADAIFPLCSAATQLWEQPAKLPLSPAGAKRAKGNERAAGMFSPPRNASAQPRRFAESLCR